MEHNIKYVSLNEKYINAAANLVKSMYAFEAESIPFLPEEKEFLSYFQKSVKTLFQKGIGVLALSDNEVIGFLVGFKVNDFFGKSNGVYIPLFGHAVKKGFRQNLYQKLYKQAANMWVEKGLLSHVITIFAHDKESVNTWFWQGFGLRCVDAIRKVESVKAYNSSVSIKKAKISDIPLIGDIHKQHNHYYRKSPIFMPTPQENPVKDLTEWLDNKDHHLWIAYDDKKPLGYMRIEPSAETFVSNHESVMNITGAYVLNSERSSGVGAMLLNEVQQWLKLNRYPLCGVDFESINPFGSNFWTKYFIPYTYSMTRRIDERISSLDI